MEFYSWKIIFTPFPPPPLQIYFLGWPPPTFIKKVKQKEIDYRYIELLEILLAPQAIFR